MSLKKYNLKAIVVEVTVNSKEENLRLLSGFRPRIRPQDYFKLLFSDPDVKRIITVVR